MFGKFRNSALDGQIHPWNSRVLIRPSSPTASDLLPRGFLLAGTGSIKAARTLPSVLIGMLIALLPKCPGCCAAYLSMFGSLGLALTPYIAWFYPLLIASLGLHLALIYHKRTQLGYGPLVLSVIGGVVVLAGRGFFANHQSVVIAGAALIFLGSLWNSFSVAPLKKQCCTTHPQL
jgi:hypothetical protein